MAWPDSCLYWTDADVRRFIQRWGLKTTFFHGCAYGLVAEHEPNKGKPMLKPWKIATNSMIVKRTFNKIKDI